MLKRHTLLSTGSSKVTEVKIVVLGDSKVGKTCMALRFCENVFHPNTQSTVGHALLRSYVDLADRTLQYNIWDTAGQENFRSMLPMYFRAASAAIVTYDITEKKSFDNLQYWMSELKKHICKDAVLAIVGNKSDLDRKRPAMFADNDGMHGGLSDFEHMNGDLQHTRQVSFEAGERLAEAHNAIFYETSAKTGDNIRNLFYKIGEQIALKLDEAERASSPSTGASFKLKSSASEKKKKWWHNLPCFSGATPTD